MRWNLTKIVPVALAATVLVPAFAEAEIVAVVGDVQNEQPPSPDLRQGEGDVRPNQSDRAYAFVELESVTIFADARLQDDLRGGDIFDESLDESPTVVTVRGLGDLTSHLIHLEPPLGARADGRVSFDGEIVAVQVRGRTLRAADPFLGRDDFEYPTAAILSGTTANSGLEPLALDRVFIDEHRFTLGFDIGMGEGETAHRDAIDQIRVVTRAPPDAELSLLCDTLEVSDGPPYRVTIGLENSGTDPSAPTALRTVIEPNDVVMPREATLDGEPVGCVQNAPGWNCGLGRVGTGFHRFAGSLDAPPGRELRVTVSLLQYGVRPSPCVVEVSSPEPDGGTPPPEPVDAGPAPTPSPPPAVSFTGGGGATCQAAPAPSTALGGWLLYVALGGLLAGRARRAEGV